MDVTKPYKFIGFGAMDVTKPYKFIGFGAMDVTKPYKFIGFGNFKLFKDRKSVILGVWAAPGALEPYKKVGGDSVKSLNRNPVNPNPFRRVRLGSWCRTHLQLAPPWPQTL